MKKCEFLSSFRFCPKCGGAFEDNNIKSKRCAECGFVYYFNPSAACVAVIRNAQGEVLVATRAKEPAKGTYDLPGGFVDSYESAEDAVKREVLEECNLRVTSVKYLFSIPNIYTYSEFDVHTVDLFFECRVDDLSPLTADDDVASLRFVSVESLDPQQFGLRSIREGVERLLSRD